MSEKTITINSQSLEGTQVESRVRTFDFVTDQPEDKGGNDSGPTPVEYLLASLGSCICIMSRMVAGKMEMKIDSVSTRVEGDIDYRGMADPDKVRPGLQEIRVEVDLKGDLSEGQKRRILKGVERGCPVTDTLKNPVEVKFAPNHE